MKVAFIIVVLLSGAVLADDITTTNGTTSPIPSGTAQSQQQEAQIKALEWNVSFYESKIKSLTKAINDPKYSLAQQKDSKKELKEDKADLEKLQDELEQLKDSPAQYEAYQLKKKSQDLLIEVDQVVSGGILADQTADQTGKRVFIQGVKGSAEGEQLKVKAYRDGTYTFTDTAGASRTVEKWVLVSQ